MKRNTLKITVSVMIITALVLVYSNAITQNGDETKERFVEATDIGATTNDDPWKEMDKLVNAYYLKDGITYSGSIQLIDDNGEKEEVIEQHPFEYSVLDNNNFNYSLASMEVICKKDLVMVVDHNNKIVAISSGLTNNPKKNQLFNIGDFKKMMEEAKAEAKVTQLGDEKILTIENIMQPDIQGYRIYYNPNTYRISKMLIGMVRPTPLVDEEEEDIEAPGDNKVADAIPGKDKADMDNETTGIQIEEYTYYMEIKYEKVQSLGLRESGYYPERKFIIVNKNRITLTPAYSSYNLMNSAESVAEQPGTVNPDEQ